MSTSAGLPRFGIGTAPLGWLYEPVSDDEARQTLQTAADHGIGFIDTAPSYGLGLAESRVGAFIAERRRNGARPPVLSTKVGWRLSPIAEGVDWAPRFPGAPRAQMRDAWTRDGVLRGFEESLVRLGVDRVDVLLIHDADEVEDLVRRETFPAVESLRAQGLVSQIGFGLNWPEVATRFVRTLDVDVVLLAGRYTLLDDSAAADFLPACLEHGTRVIAAGVFNSGVLANPAPEARYNYGRAPAELVERARRIAEVGARNGVSLPALAMHYPLTHPAVSTVVVGMRSAKEAAANARLIDSTVPPEVWTELREAGLIETSSPPGSRLEGLPG